MSAAHYRIIEHDGGWAYTAQGVYSETFQTHDRALAAARRAAAEQRAPGETRAIEYQDASGEWRVELAEGHDRPLTDVEDPSRHPRPDARGKTAADRS
jgi:hypothetical protein